MAKIVAQNDWLERGMRQHGSRGPAHPRRGRRRLTQDNWLVFERAYKAARVQVEDRNEAMARAIEEHLENNLELLDSPVSRTSCRTTSR